MTNLEAYLIEDVTGQEAPVIRFFLTTTLPDGTEEGLVYVDEVDIDRHMLERVLGIEKE